ncbi:hypothetical protein [Lederbergia citrea]|uniref:Uncharacterized protein n=1 Tax=Lederbergia citrea TaxID=2833581 RepID=A0A942UKA3_9BACI|nr:hypothetical protein [Lederbergia citrea]MBS4223026.1 hypothetical protein [Lederbergia citrea]
MTKVHLGTVPRAPVALTTIMTGLFTITVSTLENQSSITVVVETFLD